jgi:ATP-dependent exoDNAse (exonuclease V) alpha subunit
VVSNSPNFAKALLEDVRSEVRAGTISDAGAAMKTALITMDQAVEQVARASQIDSSVGEALIEKLVARKKGGAPASAPAPRVAEAVSPVEVQSKDDSPAAAAPVQDAAASAALKPEGRPELLSSLEDLPRWSVICGGAGTGKTFQARLLAEAQGAELCATTGIAALNLGAGVTTLNSLIGYFDTDALRDLWISGKLASKLGRLYSNGCRRLIIDEVSMLAGEQLAVICQAIDELARNNEEFGMGVTLVGDPAQLPPIKAKFFFDVDEFERFRPGITKLTKIHRQADQDFVAALQAVRRGDKAAAMDFFGPRVERTLIQDFQGTTILAKNEEVDRYNLMRHAQLRGEKHAWASSRWGKERGEWKQIPQTLELKEGALVMVLANCKELDEVGKPTGDYLYVNGDLGTLKTKTAAGAVVELKRGGEVVVANVIRENLVPCDSARRKELRVNDPGKLRGERQEWEAMGGVTYMPLRLAWASTVHKAQGLTLDEVQLSVANHFWEQPGMCYVALSRARTAGGLKIVGSKELLAKRIQADKRLGEWL